MFVKIVETNYFNKSRLCAIPNNRKTWKQSPVGWFVEIEACRKPGAL